jgi:hypothetical protein
MKRLLPLLLVCLPLFGQDIATDKKTVPINCTS